MNPIFNNRMINSFYDRDYYSGNKNYSYHDERKISEYSNFVWEKRIEFIKKYKDKGNFLDIGSSFGGLLDRAYKYFSTYGIELSPYAGNYSKKNHGDRIHIGTLDDHPFKDEFFSVITMIELIEHLPDPLSSIKKCYNLLEKEGLLVIQTANMEGMQAQLLKDRYAYYMPGHLSYFSKRNLILLLEESGFSRIKVFHPVEFGLMPKLKKSRYLINSPSDYKIWLKITLYHYLSKLHAGNFAATSSMVIYAFK